MRSVLVVGGGPTGLTAALELAYRGVPVTVLDDGGQRRDGSRAIAVHRSTLAVWERLGCVEPMLAEGFAWQVRRTFLGDRELYSQTMPPPGPGRLPIFLNLQQYRTEYCLIRRITSVSSIDLRWNHRVVNVAQDEAGVSLRVESSHGQHQIRADYVLACDGARSSMRKLLGLEFPGKTYSDRFLIADIRADLPFPREPRFFFDHPTNLGSTILIHPQPDGVWRFDWQLRGVVDAADQCTPEAMDRRIKSLIGEIPYELVWLSDYRFHQRMLDRLQHGRVFFLGDAAHLMAPFGARGMNSAIHDVENLGWKLARVLHEEAPETLLGTYQLERHPAQSHDQAVTTSTMRFITPHTLVQRIHRIAVLRLSKYFKAARQRVNSGRMIEPFTYQPSPILIADNISRRLWRGAPVVGAKAPEAAGTALNGANDRHDGLVQLRHLLGDQFVVLYFADDPADAQRFSSEARQFVHFTLCAVLPDAANIPSELPVIWDHAGELKHAFAAQPGTLFLIRPDGHIAARRRRARADEVACLVRQASGWLST